MKCAGSIFPSYLLIALVMSTDDTIKSWAHARCFGKESKVLSGSVIMVFVTG